MYVHIGAINILLFIYDIPYIIFKYSGMTPLSDMFVANICFQSMTYLFALLMVSFDERKFLILMKSNFSILYILSRKS